MVHLLILDVKVSINVCNYIYYTHNILFLHAHIAIYIPLVHIMQAYTVRSVKPVHDSSTCSLIKLVL